MEKGRSTNYRKLSTHFTLKKKKMHMKKVYIFYIHISYIYIYMYMWNISEFVDPFRFRFISEIKLLFLLTHRPIRFTKIDEKVFPLFNILYVKICNVLETDTNLSLFFCIICRNYSFKQGWVVKMQPLILHTGR